MLPVSSPSTVPRFSTKAAQHAINGRGVGPMNGDTRLQRRAHLFNCRSKTLVSAPVDTPPLHGMASSRLGKDVETPGRLSKTVAGLDAILGIADESLPKPTADRKSDAAPSSSALASNGTPSETAAERHTPSLLSRLVMLFSKTQSEEVVLPPKKKAPEMDMLDVQARLDALMQAISDKAVSREDLMQLRLSVFGPKTFLVTETVPLVQGLRVGVAVRGRLRGERDQVFTAVRTKLAELFPGKYEVLMVEDLEGEVVEGGGSSTAAARGLPQPAKTSVASLGPKVAFLIIPARLAVPPQHCYVKQALGVGTLGLLAAACCHFGFMANAGSLPQETLAYLERPGALQEVLSATVLPGLEGADAASYTSTVTTIAVCVFATNAVHELGHRMAARLRKVKLGPSFFIPNLDVGCFGAITPFTSLLKGRQELWDVAAAGPLAGFSFALAILAMGLVQTHSGIAQELLMPVPRTLFDGSMALGQAAHLVLGDDMLKANEVLVSPLLVAGWCGLVASALQLLPVGSLDGGRLVHAVWGKKVLAITSVCTYLGLGLGLLAGGVSLPFGLYVFLFHREPENYIQNEVTPAGQSAATLVALVTALLILMPCAPEVANLLGVGGNNAFL